MLRVLLAATVALRAIAGAQPTSARSILNKSIFVKTGAREVCSRRKRYLLQAAGAQETRRMRTFLARLFVLAALADGPAALIAIRRVLWRVGQHSSRCFRRSFPRIPHSDHVANNSTSIPSRRQQRSAELGTSAGNAIASGARQLPFKAWLALRLCQRGAGDVTNGGFSSAAAGAMTVAAAIMIDEWDFEFEPASKYIHVDCKIQPLAESYDYGRWRKRHAGERRRMKSTRAP